MDLFNSAFVGLTILAMAGSVTFAMYSVGGTALAVVVGQSCLRSLLESLGPSCQLRTDLGLIFLGWQS